MITPRIARMPTATATPIPALAPVLSPEEEAPLVGIGADVVVGVAVAVAVVEAGTEGALVDEAT